MVVVTTTKLLTPCPVFLVSISFTLRKSLLCLGSSRVIFHWHGSFKRSMTIGQELITYIWNYDHVMNHPYPNFKAEFKACMTHYIAQKIIGCNYLSLPWSQPHNGCNIDPCPWFKFLNDFVFCIWNVKGKWIAIISWCRAIIHILSNLLQEFCISCINLTFYRFWWLHSRIFII